MEVGLIGAGLQGERRATALMGSKTAKLALIADKDFKKAERLAGRVGCDATDSWREVLKASKIELVLVCTPNVYHAPMSIAAMRTGKNVFCEKPLARTVREGEKMVLASRKYSVALSCGFNLRYHPAIKRALKWKLEGKLGRIMFVRSVYGICGRADYQNDWRMSGKVSGGGQLLDQGMHVLDLCNLFCGKFREVKGWVATSFWKIPVEDNAFALLRSVEGSIANLHVSWTQWKNLFSFEVFGTKAAAIVQGLGGSYGDERLVFLRRPSNSEPFTETCTEYRGEDRSYKNELVQIIRSLRAGKSSDHGGPGLEALRLAHAIYQSSLNGQTVKLS